MKKNKKILVIILILVIVIVMGFLMFMYLEKKSYDNYKYLIKYDDMFVPGNTYDIYIFNNYDIKVIKHYVCSTLSCTNKDEKFNVNLSDNNKEKIKKLIEHLYSNNNENQLNIKSADLDENSQKVFNTIIFNDEEFIEKYYDENIKYDFRNSNSILN